GRLIIYPAIVLVGVAHEKVVAIVEAVIHASVVAPIVVGRGDGLNGPGAQELHELEFAISCRIDVDAGLLAGTLESKESERTVLCDRSADGSAELLAGKRSLLARSAVLRFLEMVHGVQRFIAAEEIRRTVIAVAAALGDHLDG